MQNTRQRFYQMKKFLCFLLLSTSLAFGQAAQRIGVAAVNSGGYLKVLSGATITVCQYNVNLQCTVPVTTYQDPFLTQPNTTPFYADANGNYMYFASPVNIYLEQVCSPGTPCYIRPVLFGVGGPGTVSVNSVIISTPNFNSINPAPDAGYTALLFKVSGSDVIVEAPFAKPPPIGTLIPNVGIFTNLTITGTCTGCGSTDWAHPGQIGSGTPNTGAFTTLTSQGGALNGTIGAGTPLAGTFTTLNASTGTISVLNSSSGALNGTIGATTPNDATFDNVVVLGTCTNCATTDWGSPGALGSVAPNSVNATHVDVNFINVINTSGQVVAGAACPSGSPSNQTFCRGDGFWTTVSAASVQAAQFGPTCTTPGGGTQQCGTTYTIPSAYPDTGYSAACSLLGTTGFPDIMEVSKTPTTITVTIKNGTANQAVASSAAEVDCIFSHN